MLEKDTYDAIVIGAGIVGTCTALELAKSGRKILCVDKNPVAGAGSTGNSCAIIRTHYSTLNGAALALSNYPYWEQWEDYLGGIDPNGMARYKEVGCLYTCYKENGYGAKLEKIALEIGIPYEVWTPEIMKNRVPIISAGNFFPAKPEEDPEFGTAPDDMRYVLFFPRAGYISDPQLASRNVQFAAQSHGADFQFGDAVASIDQSSGRVSGITLQSGKTFEAPIVVNVGGPHSYKLNEMAGVTEGMNIGTKALRVEVAHVPSPKGYDFENNGIIGSDADIGGYYRPEVGNHILIGSEEPECDPLEWVDPDNYNQQLTKQARLQALRGGQRFPTMGIPDSVKGIVDLYDASDDWIPIYDCSDLPGYYMAVGTSGNQFKNGPVVGMMMTALIDYVEDGNDHDAEPLVFPLPNIDYRLDMSFCSRRREINRESSFSVVG